MIFYDEQRELFHLQTEKTSYIFGFLEGRFFTHLYWGGRLEQPVADYGDFLDLSNAHRHMTAMDYTDCHYSSDVLPSEFPTFGNTDLRTPAFHARYKDGTRISDFHYTNHNIYKGKKPLVGLPATYVESDDEATSLDIVLTDHLTGMVVTLTYTVFEQLNAITRSVRVVNSGKESVALQALLSATVDFNGMEYDMIHLPGAWARERHPERAPLFHGKQLADSLRGASSCQQNPFFALVGHNTTEEKGDAYGFSLVYSGNFVAGVEVDAYHVSRAMIGIHPFDFCYHLESGESFQSPEAVLVYSGDGIGGMSRIYHRLYRTRLCRGQFRDKERYVLINNWEATYFNFDEEKIVAIASKAKEVGVELMVLDDGWFGHRNNDLSSLGDWYVNKDKLPNGLESLVSKINALGMKFGLWFEPEMVSPDSDCYRTHPDWCIHVKDRNRTLCRTQLMLDLSREDVCNYVIDCLSDILNRSPIAYVKWDYNRNMTNIGSALLPPERQGEFYHRYILGLYHILETLTKRFPNVLFESCSSGGARFDPGMLYYMPQTWCSDDTDAVERAFIQYGTSFCYPYSSMGAHVSAVPNHQVGRRTPMSARGAIAMQGQLGYELDLNRLSEEELQQVAKQVQFYKQYGSVFHTGDLYRLNDPAKQCFVANEFIAQDQNTVIMTALVIKGLPEAPVEHIRLCGLDAKAQYRLEGCDRVYRGDFLMNVGIAFQPSSDYKNTVMVFRKQ